MRKIISGICIFIFCISLMTGCSKEEIGYLNLLREASSVNSRTGTGSIEVELGDFWVQNGILPAKEKIVIDYSLKSDRTYLNANLGIKNNGKKIADLEIILDFETEYKAYISTKGILDLTTFYYNKLGNKAPEGFMQALKDNDYVIFDMGGEVNTATAIDKSKNSKYLYDFLQNTFHKFTTGVVTGQNREYKVSLSPQQVYGLVKNTVDYISKDPKGFYGKYIQWLKDMKLPQDNITLISSKEKEFTAVLASIKEQLAENEKDFSEFVTSQLEGSKIEYTFKKDSGNYVESANLELYYMEKGFLKVTYKDTKTPSAISRKKISGKVIHVDELNEILNQPGKFETLSLDWELSDSEGLTSAIASYENENVAGIYPMFYFVSDNSLYLPLRDVCQALGEEVDWDDQTNTAYVIRNGTRVEMPGIMKEGTTYIKVRDLEKLGYTIDYKAGVNSAWVVISKPE